MKECSDKLKLNFIGHGITIFGKKLTQEEIEKFEETAIHFKMDLEQAVLDLDFFPKLGIEKYKSLYDLNEDLFECGLLIDSRMQIEIWIGRKRRRTIFDLEFDRGQLGNPPMGSKDQLQLFENYVVQYSELRLEDKCENWFLLLERHVGMFKVCTREVQSFDIDKLVFRVYDTLFAPIPPFSIVSEPLYDGKKLNCKLGETLIQERRVFIFPANR